MQIVIPDHIAYGTTFLNGWFCGMATAGILVGLVAVGVFGKVEYKK